MSRVRIISGIVGLLLWAAERLLDYHDLIPVWATLCIWVVAGFLGVMFIPPGFAARRTAFAVAVAAFAAFFAGAEWKNQGPILAPELRPVMDIYESKERKAEISRGSVTAWFTVENRGQTTAKDVTIYYQPSGDLPGPVRIPTVLDYLPGDKHRIAIYLSTFLGPSDESITVSVSWTDIAGVPDSLSVAFDINYQDGRLKIAKKKASEGSP